MFFVEFARINPQRKIINLSVVFSFLRLLPQQPRQISFLRDELSTEL